jgi:D-alanyl-D-alanine carboxypeptidase (penicillin-binding protein 5/6)
MAEEVAPPVRGARRRERRRRRHLITVLLICVVIVLLIVGGLVAVLVQPLPRATLAIPTRVLLTSGAVPAVHWPTEGQGAYAIDSLGVSDHSPGETPQPIGSLAKMMTALLVLRDHPLTAGEQGPTVTISAADAAGFVNDLATDQSNVRLVTGEVLTERQLLEGLLVHSANDVADVLARWDAGSLPAFTTKMNAAAAELGMHQTTYTDPAGFDPGTVSTAADQLVVASAAMAVPTFAQIVSLPSVSLPEAGVVSSYTPLIGTDGVIGVKSGLTTQAGGCDVMATVTTVGGHHVLVLSAVLGQMSGSDRLAAAGAAALSINQSAATGIVTVRAVSAQRPVSTVGWPSSRVGVVTSRDLDVPSWPGHRVVVAPRLTRSITGSLEAQVIVGAVRVRSGTFSASASLATARALPEPGIFERLG